jgi:hypothetical protein
MKKIEFVIASHRVARMRVRVREAIQSSKETWIASAFALRASADAVVARAPRNDGAGVGE